MWKIICKSLGNKINETDKRESDIACVLRIFYAIIMQKNIVKNQTEKSFNRGINSMIQVLTGTAGWMDYCEEGIKTDLVDMDGITLKTGDVVEILQGDWFRSGNISKCRVGTAIIVFDQYENFFCNDQRFFLEGWFSYDWKNNDQFLIRKVDQSEHKENSHYRIFKNDVDNNEGIQ